METYIEKSSSSSSSSRENLIKVLRSWILGTKDCYARLKAAEMVPPASDYGLEGVRPVKFDVGIRDCVISALFLGSMSCV